MRIANFFSRLLRGWLEELWLLTSDYSKHRYHRKLLQWRAKVQRAYYQTIEAGATSYLFAEHPRLAERTRADLEQKLAEFLEIARQRPLAPNEW